MHKKTPISPLFIPQKSRKENKFYAVTNEINGAVPSPKTGRAIAYLTLLALSLPVYSGEGLDSASYNPNIFRYWNTNSGFLSNDPVPPKQWEKTYIISSPPNIQKNLTLSNSQNNQNIPISQGNAQTQFDLGMKYLKGYGVEQSDSEAVKRFYIAAKQGNALAQFWLGRMYQNGRGGEQSDTKAVKWYRLAGEQGHEEAQYTLGKMYCYGEGAEKSPSEAIKWYDLAADQGNALAQFALGNLYKYKYKDEEGSDGWKQTAPWAAKWYRKDANKGNAKAQYKLGVMYTKGAGVEQSYSEAMKWFRLAADQGHDEALKNLVETQNKLALLYS